MARTINLNHIAKIEGHAKLHVRIEKNKVKSLRLKIFEGSRFFQGIVKGQKFDDVPHITSRICGICSVSHNLAAIKAIENAFKVKASSQTNVLREVLQIGGFIQSHVLHLYFLSLPDYYGYNNALELAKKKNGLLETAIEIKRLGNLIVNTIGGRDIHPITSIPGGFSVVPDKDKIDYLLGKLKKIKKQTKKTVELFESVKVPKFSRKTDLFALSGGSYFYSDKIIKNKNKQFPVLDYESHIKEYFCNDSTSEYAIMDNKPYKVGAVARLIMSKHAKKIKDPYNPFYNNLAQAIEMHQGVLRAIELLQSSFRKQKPARVVVKKGKGIGAIEAPRGMLFHRYNFNGRGYCTSANLTTPTSQNLQSIQSDLRDFIPTVLRFKKERIKLEIEKLIRAYDPCISCSTHFLELDME